MLGIFLVADMGLRKKRLGVSVPSGKRNTENLGWILHLYGRTSGDSKPHLAVEGWGQVDLECGSEKQDTLTSGNWGEKTVGKKGNSANFRSPAGVGRRERAGLRGKCKLSLDHCACDTSGKRNRGPVWAQSKDFCRLYLDESLSPARKWASKDKKESHRPGMDL